MEQSSIELNKFTRSNHSETLLNDTKRPFMVHSMWSHYFIVLDNAVHPAEGQWFIQELQPNGDIYLRLVDIFNSKNRSRPPVSQQADDQDYGGSE